MTRTPPLHPVQKSINRPLTIWGAERRLFFVALVMGATTFNFFGSLLGGLLMFGALLMFARWAYSRRSRDPANRLELRQVRPPLTTLLPAVGRPAASQRV